MTYVNIPGDHSIFKQKPDEVAKAIGDFLGTLKWYMCELITAAVPDKGIAAVFLSFEALL